MIIVSSKDEIGEWLKCAQICCDMRNTELLLICGAPPEILEAPTKLAEAALILKEKYVGPFATVEPDSESLKEIWRLRQILTIYEFFSCVVVHFGISVAEQFLRFGERQFVHEKETFWWWWSAYLNACVRDVATLECEPKDYESLKTLVDRMLVWAQEIEVSFLEANCDRKFQEFELDELTLLISKEKAYRSWRQINLMFSTQFRQEIYECGAKLVREHDAEIDMESLRSYCMSV